MRIKHRSNGVADERAATPAQAGDGLVSTVTHAAGDIGSGIRDAGEKVREVTAKGAHEVVDAVRDATEAGGHAAASAGDSVSQHAQGAAVVVRTHRRKLGLATAAAASAAFAVLAALIARRPRR
jgi:hypothetical protein